MENLIKQVRKRGPGQKEEPGRNIESRSQPQKTPSFKKEKKRAQNWFRRHFSWQMSEDYDSDGPEYATAVAAAAFVITSLEETRTQEPNKIEEPEPSFTGFKSKRQDRTVSIIAPGRVSKRFPGEDSDRSSNDQTKVRETETKEEHGKVVSRTPSTKTTTTFSDKTSTSKPTESKKKNLSLADNNLDDIPDRKFESVKPPDIEVPKPALRTKSKFEKPADMKKTDLPTTNPSIPIPKAPWSTTSKPEPWATDIPRQSPTVNGETEADVWERAELEKIRKRYEGLNNTILTWEDKKKTKARSRLDKTEGELERTRLKALEQFRKEMGDITQIAGGARAKATEKQRYEELSVKEKANSIRRTGKVPRTCFCF